MNNTLNEMRITESELLELKEFVKDYNLVRERLYLQLIPVVGNEDMLKDVPYTEMEDLAIIYRIQIKEEGNYIVAVTVNNNLLKHYGIDKETLHLDALRSAPKVAPAVFVSMDEMLRELHEGLEKEYPFAGSESELKLYVATNEKGHHGASVILYPMYLESLRDKLGGNFYIFPSSIHEVIIMRDDYDMNLSDMRKMVKSINGSVVALEDRLSDNVYHYDGNLGRITVAQEEGVA